MSPIIILCVIGFVVSLYAYYVEIMMMKSLTFKPFCDISDSITCSEVIGSEYGRLFGIPNSILGALYYSALMFLFNINEFLIMFIMILVGGLITLFLLQVLIFRIKKFCVVCYAIYVVNFLLVIFSYVRNF